MTPEELTAAALEYVRSRHAAAIADHPADATYPAPVIADVDEHSPIVAMTLARWAAYADPAALPAGWIDYGRYAAATGIRQVAAAPNAYGGDLYNDAPRRLIPWTCSAGIRHWRYWRRIHHPNRPALVACEHQPEPVELPR
jgi:hypothetical protein